MENLHNDPIDEQITNDDNSITNKDGDNMLEQEEGANVQDKPDDVRVPTVTPGTTTNEPPAADSDEAIPEDNKDSGVATDPSNTHSGPKGENL